MRHAADTEGLEASAEVIANAVHVMRHATV
jgi:hypothetical protein